MSTFPGLFSEIPKISVDRFDGKNLSSEVFFLSHFHADHMVGLRTSEFHAVLRKKESAIIYCSELTALFLAQNHLNGLSNKIKVLSINKEHTISIDEECGFLIVTPLPAGHCPGSIMFLFTYRSLNYLYTGDYRMTKENILKMKALKDPDGKLKPIETLYLDTTFFQPVYSYLPTRDKSMSELIRMCKSWMDKGDDYVIDLRTPATIGVEYVLIALSQEFGMPFHISDAAYEKYVRIPELSSAVTKDRTSRLHVCIAGHRWNGRSLFMKYHKNWKEHNVLSVKLCALHAKNFSEDKDLVTYSEHQHLHRLVYSSHSSHGELLEMIETLLPKKIEPCVVPVDYTAEQVVETLQSCTSHQVQRSESEEMPVLQFSSYEDVPDSDSDAAEADDVQRKIVKNGSVNVKDKKEEVKGSRALMTLCKYNVKDSSDEEQCWKDESDEDELPPFRWDCYHDASKALGFQKKERLPFKRRKINSS